jgi:nitrogen-specific signal transduction histidine kinase/ActR/RegA family two-component response regulator
VKRSDKTILILRDVTAQKRAEQEREAGRKAMALAEITTILAHEIRNPLASLELFAELIEQDGGNRGEWISNLRAGIRSLSGTVNNVLSFHGAGSLTLAPVMLSAQIGNAIQFVRPIADQAGVSLEFVADHDQVDVMGNESALQQVFLNLLSNAIRHTPAGGKVTVSIRREGSAINGEEFAKDSGQIVVQFSDTGCGIRPDQIDRVFEPGFSGGGDTTGLGLAVCERLMKKHGGRISVSNRINSGAIFTLYFSRTSTRVGHGMNSNYSDGRNSSVLVVDDEPGMRTALSANFMRHGWRVETASGVRDAERACELTSFDLVVTDIHMRDGDGFEVMCSVQKTSPTTAVILLTAFGSVPEAVESMRIGAFDYLTKPVSFEQLQTAAARVMERINKKTPVVSFSKTARMKAWPIAELLATLHCYCKRCNALEPRQAPTPMF